MVGTERKRHGRVRDFRGKEEGKGRKGMLQRREKREGGGDGKEEKRGEGREEKGREGGKGKGRECREGKIF